jgi:hypothetical protein
MRNRSGDLEIGADLVERYSTIVLLSSTDELMGETINYGVEKR